MLQRRWQLWLYIGRLVNVPYQFMAKTVHLTNFSVHGRDFFPGRVNLCIQTMTGTVNMRLCRSGCHSVSTFIPLCMECQPNCSPIHSAYRQQISANFVQCVSMGKTHICTLRVATSTHSAKRQWIFVDIVRLLSCLFRRQLLYIWSWWRPVSLFLSDIQACFQRLHLERSDDRTTRLQQQCYHIYFQSESSVGQMIWNKDCQRRQDSPASATSRASAFLMAAFCCRGHASQRWSSPFADQKQSNMISRDQPYSWCRTTSQWCLTSLI